MGDEVRLVALFKCKQCGVRLYEQDAHGHLERHGLTDINGNWREYFTKGKKDTADRPGARYKPLYRKSEKPKPRDVTLN